MLDDKALDLLFREARSQNAYADVPISDDTLKALYDIWKYITINNRTSLKINFWCFIRNIFF